MEYSTNIVRQTHKHTQMQRHTSMQRKHVDTNTCIDTQTHTQTYRYMQTNAHSNLQMHTDKHAQTDTHRAQNHVYTDKFTQRHRYTRHTQTRTHIEAHKDIQADTYRLTDIQIDPQDMEIYKNTQQGHRDIETHRHTNINRHRGTQKQKHTRHSTPNGHTYGHTQHSQADKCNRCRSVGIRVTQYMLVFTHRCAHKPHRLTHTSLHWHPHSEAHA